MPGCTGQRQTTTCDSRNNRGQINVSGDCARLARCAQIGGSMTENTRALILIVDDDTAVRELLKLHLVGEGYDVRLADDAIVAGRSPMEAPPDLMLVDVAMPYIDGIDFVATLKADAAAPQVPIVFI